MTYCVIDTGDSRSFPESEGLLEMPGYVGDVAGADIVVLIGAGAGRAFADLGDVAGKTAVLIELGTECLGEHTGEQLGNEGGNVLGFARFRLGDAAPSNLVELVRQPASHALAIDAARQLFQARGLKVAVCNDFPGRIIDRLIRPYYNAALRRLDEKLASAEDMDLTLRLGLGYPEGPLALLERTGLAHHFDVTQALYEALGDAAYVPARRARVAKARSVKRISETSK